jgi:hypothetical protein
MNFSDFIRSRSFNVNVKESLTAQKVYEDIIWRDDVRIKMVELTDAGIPALAACVGEIEELCSSDDSDLDLTNMQIRTTIGRMVAAALEPYGYTSKGEGAKLARLPYSVGSKYFTKAKVFAYAGGETQRIVKTIVNV